MTETHPFRRIRYLERVTLSGALCMIFVGCVNSPVFTDVFRRVGATELHFGLLSGIPMAMLVMQFIGAYWTNRMRHRRGWFMTLVIASRLLYLPLAVLPFCTGASPGSVIIAMIAILSLSSALTQITLPMWLSWMGDLIPRRILSRYWGGRQRVLTLTLTGTSLLVTAIAFYGHAIAPRMIYLLLAAVGVTAGVLDILQFRHIREPPNLRMDAHPLHILMQPLRDKHYRAMVLFSVAFSGVSMLAAAFMQIYTLDVLQVPLWQTALLWCAPGLGAATVAPLWGRLADRFGSRPILRVCVALKPIIALVFLFVTPATAVPVLAVALLLDSMLNSGNEIATNGFMLKLAPRENRSMFIASITALSGMASAAGAITGGLVLSHTSTFHLALFGREWNHYQLLFLVSFLLRLPCIRLARRIHEPESARSRVVVSHLLGLWPLRMFVFPVGLYRRIRFPDEEDVEASKSRKV